MCFDIEGLLIWLVVVIGLIMIVQLLIPWLMSLAGLPPIVVGILKIVLWMIVAIAVIKIIFILFACIGGVGHLFR